MKKLFVFTGAIIISCHLFSQKLPEGKVPVAAKNAFNKAYPSARGKWEKEDSNYEVSFKLKGNNLSCLISSQGTIVETETDISIQQLPPVATAYMNTHYKGQKITEAAKIVKASGEVNYEAEIKGKDILFDASGNFLKEIKHGAGDKEEKD